MTHIVKKDERACLATELPRVFPVELGANIDGIAPAGLPIMSSCFIVEKMDVAICNGRDQWYTTNANGATKYISAGQPWSALFG